jgi:hypothetical protein
MNRTVKLTASKLFHGYNNHLVESDTIMGTDNSEHFTESDSKRTLRERLVAKQRAAEAWASTAQEGRPEYRKVSLTKTIGMGAIAFAGVTVLAFGTVIGLGFFRTAEAQAKPVALGDIHVKGGKDTLESLTDKIQPITVSLAKSKVVSEATISILGSAPIADTKRQDIEDTTFNVSYTKIDATYDPITKILTESLPGTAITVAVKPEAHILNKDSEEDLPVLTNLLEDTFNAESNSNASTLHFGADIINAITNSKLSPSDVPILNELAGGQITFKNATDQIDEKANLDGALQCLPSIANSKGFDTSFESNIRTLAEMTFFDKDAPHIALAKSSLAALMSLPDKERDEIINNAHIKLPANYKKGITLDPQLAAAVKKYKSSGVVSIKTDKFKCADANSLVITEANGKKVKNGKNNG